MSKLKQEILNNLNTSPKMLSITKLTELSKVTRHERRVSACLLELEDDGMVKHKDTDKYGLKNRAYK